MRSVHAATGLCLIACMVSWGCAQPGPPRFRLGSLPFPGLFTLYVTADPENLGDHRCESVFLLPSGETERGVLYTCRAGFLDVAHIRASVDWSRYYALRLRLALAEEAATVKFRAVGPDDLVIAFHYPPDWPPRDDPSREALVRELAIVLGQELAWITTAWHEIVTWHGYKSIVVVPEDQSAFTYDDTMSHVVGLMVADAAMRDTSAADFNGAVTRWLDHQLHELGVVSEKQCAEAVQRVKGRWWKHGRSLRRFLDLGLEDRRIEPWLVPGFEPCGKFEPTSWELPRLDSILGRDFRGFLQVEIEPQILEWGRIRLLLPGKPDRVRPEEHFAIIMADIRRSLVEELGEACDQPE